MIIVIIKYNKMLENNQVKVVQKWVMTQHVQTAPSSDERHFIKLTKKYVKHLPTHSMLINLFVN